MPYYSRKQEKRAAAKNADFCVFNAKKTAFFWHYFMTGWLYCVDN